MARTKYEQEDLFRSGNEMTLLAEEYRPRLEPRCEAGLIEGLKADVPLLFTKQEATTNVRTDKQALTLSQNDALEKGAKVLSLLRNSVRSHLGADKEVQKAFGIGKTINPGSVVSVAAGLKKMIDAAADYPEKTRAAGILPEDVELLQRMHDALVAADGKQENKKVSSKNTTAERNATQARIESALDKIFDVSQFVFRDEPEISIRFENAMPKPRASKSASTRKKPAPAPKPA